MSSFFSVFSNMIIMILLLSILIIVHELGHFIAARLCGVRVTRFGFGMPFGPSWKMFRWKNTDFYLHACLFGGYVSFPDDEESLNDDEKQELSDNEILPPDSPELYENKTIPQKLFIVTAGVLMNIITAIVIVIGCALYYHKLPTSSFNIVFQNFANKTMSNISNYDIQKNDKISKINGLKIETNYGLSFISKSSKMFDDYAQESLIKYNLETLKKLNPNIEENLKIGQKVVLPNLKAEEPVKLSENSLKGLEKYNPIGKKLTKDQIDLRDTIYLKKEIYSVPFHFSRIGRILSEEIRKTELLNSNIQVFIGKQSVVFLPRTITIPYSTNLTDLAYALSDTYKPMTFELQRNDKTIILDDVAVYSNGKLGILFSISEFSKEIKSIPSAIIESTKYIYETTKTMLFSLWQLIRGKVSTGQMHGIIAVVKVGGDVITKSGMFGGWLLTAMISLNLAIMNFLPIPALDGGHVMFLIIEKLTGKKPSKETSDKITNFFFQVLIILMILICYNDIIALIAGKF